jgi:hypothetical protein
MIKRETRTTFAAFALPVVLLLAQGGSCGGGTTAGGDNGGARANRPAGAASNKTDSNGGGATPPLNAPADGNAAGGPNSNAGGRTKGAAMNDGQKKAIGAGTWGGAGVRLDVKEGSAEVEFDCAHGALGEIAPAENGEFSVSGVFVRERGGPVRAGEEPEKIPARYSGKISGETMTLRVSIQGVADELTYTLTRGKAGPLRKCL